SGPSSSKLSARGGFTTLVAPLFITQEFCVLCAIIVQPPCRSLAWLGFGGAPPRPFDTRRPLRRIPLTSRSFVDRSCGIHRSFKRRSFRQPHSKPSAECRFAGGLPTGFTDPDLDSRLGTEGFPFAGSFVSSKPRTDDQPRAPWLPSLQVHPYLSSLNSMS